jgi:uncharacterized membrane protein (DUF373 family)
MTFTPKASSGTSQIESGFIPRIFVLIEHTFYFVTGVLLAITAALALLSAGISIASASISWGAPEEIIVTIDRLLFVLMLLEILHTVRVSIRDGILTPDPFLVVGLIASIRRVLVITLGSSQATHPGNWTPETQAQFNASMMELGVLSVLILVMVVAIFLLRRGREGKSHLLQADGSPLDG